MALAWDIEESQDLHPAFDRADILYTEPPWRHGYHVFHYRANIKSKSFTNFVTAVNTIIANRGTRPAIIMTGRDSAKLYTTPDLMVRCSNDSLGDFHALLYGIDSGVIDFTDRETILSDLADQFNCIGDFCCGYGNAARIFYQYGKEFVVSDINPKCIGFISKDYLNWRKNENL